MGHISSLILYCSLIIEQGQEIGRDGRVHVKVTNGDKIEVTGTAVYVNEFEVSI